MGTQRVHKARQVMDYVWANADRPITVEEISKELSWAQGSISTVCGKMITTYPEQMERLARGVYRWNSEKRDAEPVEVTEMLVTIVKRRDDGQILVQDTATNALYTMRELDW